MLRNLIIKMVTELIYVNILICQLNVLSERKCDCSNKKII